MNATVTSDSRETLSNTQHQDAQEADGPQKIARAAEENRTREQNPEEGSTTVEYAIGAIAAATFAGILIAIMKSGAVRGALTAIIQQALTI